MLEVYHLHTTKKLPSVGATYVGMQVSITTSVQPPFAVQDVTGQIVALDLHPDDARQVARKQADVVLQYLPYCVYIKLDNSSSTLLPPNPDCSENMTEVFALKPLKRDWHFTSKSGFKTAVPEHPGYRCSVADSLCSPFQSQNFEPTEIHWPHSFDSRDH